MKANEIYEKLYREFNPKGRRTLVIVKEIIDEMEIKGLEITIRGIARTGKVGESSIRNSVRLRGYIQDRVLSCIGAVELTGDEVLMERIKELEQENRVLRGLMGVMILK